MTDFDEDLFEYSIEVRQNLVVPKPNNAISASRYQVGAVLIRFNTRNLPVLRTVKLDYETSLPAAEIYDKLTDWKLATKLEAAKLTPTKVKPELLFSGSRIAAEYPCQLMNMLAVGRKLVCQSTPSWPPPGQGEGLNLSHSFGRRATFPIYGELNA